MLKYLIVILADDAPAICRYDNLEKGHGLMSLSTLKDTVLFGLKHNLTFQFIFPDYSIDEEKSNIIENVDHVSYVTSNSRYIGDVVVLKDNSDISSIRDSNVILITAFDLTESLKSKIIWLLANNNRVNLIFKNYNGLTNHTHQKYSSFLDAIVEVIKKGYNSSPDFQMSFNLLTDRLSLGAMNDCGAGVESITVAPDGKFYICPAFYYGDSESVGSVKDGLQIPNQRLYELSQAPICSICDAYHCNRCIWLNLKGTHEVNTPTRNQCMAAHIERNASKKLKDGLISHKNFCDIPEIDYIDPLDKMLRK